MKVKFDVTDDQQHLFVHFILNGKKMNKNMNLITQIDNGFGWWNLDETLRMKKKNNSIHHGVNMVHTEKCTTFVSSK